MAAQTDADPRSLELLLCFEQRSNTLTCAERVADDPWKVLMAATLLNKTTGKAAIPVFWDIIARYPTPVALTRGRSLRSSFQLRSVTCLAETFS